MRGVEEIIGKNDNKRGEEEFPGFRWL